jgi:site-specific DNA recombinase
MRASLNVRLSKAAGATNVSRDGMVADLRALCAREGFEEVALHIDDGQSGAIRDRPGFLRWTADAREGRADVLLAWHVDRMTREGLNVAATLLDVVEGKHPVTGKVVYPPVRLMDTKGIDSNNGAAFRMMFLIGAEVAREERERMRDRNRVTGERLRRAGRWAGGHPPYGYAVAPHPDGAGKTLVVKPAEAAIVQEAAQMVLAGHGINRVCRWLNEQGHRGQRGGQWRRSSLTQILTGNAIVGGVTIDGKPVRDADGRLFTPYPAIIDLDAALALRTMLAPKEAREYAGRAPARLLSGIITCGSCGERLRVYHKGNGEVSYRCSTRGYGQLCERPVTVATERAEEVAAREFLTGFGRLPMTRERVVVVGGASLAAVDDQIAATLAELGTAATPERFARLQELQAERVELERAPRVTRIERIPTGRTVAEEWEARDVEGRREMLAGAVELLSVGPGSHRGRRGFDPSRVRIIWAEGEHDPD